MMHQPVLKNCRPCIPPRTTAYYRAGMAGRGALSLDIDPCYPSVHFPDDLGSNMYQILP